MKRLLTAAILGSALLAAPAFAADYAVLKLGAQGNIVEVMVAQTKYSYTYAQPTNPGLGILYHGTLSAEPIDKGHTKLMYSVVWDIEPDGAQDKKDADKANRTRTFTAALASMKALAEGK